MPSTVSAFGKGGENVYRRMAHYVTVGSVGSRHNECSVTSTGILERSLGHSRVNHVPWLLRKPFADVLLRMYCSPSALSKMQLSFPFQILMSSKASIATRQANESGLSFLSLVYAQTTPCKADASLRLCFFLVLFAKQGPP